MNKAQNFSDFSESKKAQNTLNLHTLFLFLSLFLVACGEENTSADDANLGNNDGNGEEEVGGNEDCFVSEDEEAMLVAVNAARSSSRVCGEQSFSATTPLTLNCKLQAAALSHSEDMAAVNFFSHTGSDGLSVSQRVSNQSYDWRRVGENIAAGQQTVDAVMTSWLNSPGHCANIMDSRYTEFGSASAENANADYRIYWTQVFATPR